MSRSSRKYFLRSLVLAFMLALFASTASAQTSPTIFGGYLYAHTDSSDRPVSLAGSLNGFFAGVDVPAEGRAGIEARVDAVYGTPFRQGLVVGPMVGTDIRPYLYTVTAGPRVSVTRARATLFADALFGVAHGRARSMGIDFLAPITDTAFVGGGGGGALIAISRTVGVRGDVQYRRTTLVDSTFNAVQVGVGVVVTP